MDEKQRKNDSETHMYEDKKTERETEGHQQGSGEQQSVDVNNPILGDNARQPQTNAGNEPQENRSLPVRSAGNGANREQSGADRQRTSAGEKRTNAPVRTGRTVRKDNGPAAGKKAGVADAEKGKRSGKGFGKK